MASCKQRPEALGDPGRQRIEMAQIARSTAVLSSFRSDSGAALASSLVAEVSLADDNGIALAHHLASASPNRCRRCQKLAVAKVDEAEAAAA
ncbi:hypothetical protein PTT_08657 [Pyrenophora teres f. teres 0-1]|uniref:Uncharacterized protein n=1 Tax=Pyrenophora teres f. teres (strain 0-1) TaxID=861557 RepID=E3RKA9_PYRTT|nr:hypothetical protein PTT_08657 [Pyrenophora teres f. teres 0-1]